MKHPIFQYTLAAVLLLTVCGIPVRAQSLDPFNPYSSVAPSAETYSMVRYGGLTPSLYSGAMSYSVPVFTYQDPDFTIPVSLDYNFDGYKPSQHSGTVGYGWSLNCGGVITREVRGIPDDDYFHGTGDRATLGYYWTARSPHASVSNEVNDTTRLGTTCHSGGPGIVVAQNTSRINLYSHTPLHSTYRIDTLWVEIDGNDFEVLDVEITDPTAYDMTPDIYHFQIPGHGGDFMFMPDGSVRVFNSDLPHGELKVEFQPPTSCRWTDEIPWCGFIITTGDGTKYTFGGNYESIEYARSSTTQPPQRQSWSAVAFRLRRIEAPNGRTVTFSYSHLKQSSLLSQYYYSPKYHGYNHTEGLEYHRHSRTFFSVLTGISVDGVERIRFSYEAKDQNEDAAAYFDSFSLVSTGIPVGIYPASDAVRLSGIELLDDTGIVVQQAALTQSYASGGTPKMFLSSVTTTKGGMHTFTYDQASSLPKNDTGSTDHWGYWNGYSGYYFDPRTDVIPNAGRFEQMNPSCTKKDPYPATAVRGGLTRITYPTGGTTQIRYEGNEAEKGLEEEGQIWEPQPGAFPVGGVRVCTLIDSSSVAAVPDTTVFQYSGGFLYQMPRYALRFSYHYIPPLLTDPHIPEIEVTGYNGDVDYAVSGDRFVGYCSVVRIHPDHSRTETVFCSYDNGFGDGFGLDGDGMYSNYPLITKRLLFTDGDKIENSNYYGAPVTICASVDRRNMRGRPLCVSVKDAAGVLRKKTEYTYAADTVALGWIYMNNVDTFLAMPWKSLSPVQTRETTTEYVSAGIPGPVTVRATYYNTAGQVSCETAWSPQQAGDTLRTHFQYLHEAGLAASSDALPGALYMAARTRTSGGIRYLLDGVRYTYACADTHIKPQRVDKYRIDAPLQLPAQASWTEAVGALPVDGTLQFGYDPGTYFPTYVRMPGDAWEGYVWTGLYPAVKRMNSSVNCLYYTWQDQVGLKSVTAPSGSAETYDYDIHARLRLVKDPDGAPVTLYDYQLSNDQ